MVQTAPDLIFVFQGPILRCSKGNLPAEVKQVVWHEIANWLGHDEGEVKELGLSLSFKDIVHDPLESEAPITATQERLDTVEKEEEANEQPRCIKYYVSDVTCHDVEKPLSYPEANSFDPITVASISSTSRRFWASNTGTSAEAETLNLCIRHAGLRGVFRSELKIPRVCPKTSLLQTPPQQAKAGLGGIPVVPLPKPFT